MSESQNQHGTVVVAPGGHYVNLAGKWCRLQTRQTYNHETGLESLPYRVKEVTTLADLRRRGQVCVVYTPE